MPCLSPLLYWTCCELLMRCVRSAALGDVREAGQEVVPALGVRCDRALGQTAVHQPEPGAVSLRLEVDLDGAAPRRDHRVVLPAPGEHHSAVRHDLNEFTHDGALVLGKVDPEIAAGSWL